MKDEIMRLADEYAQHKYVNGAEGRGPDTPEKRTQWARDALEAAVEKLVAELDATKADAQRYRFVRQADGFLLDRIADMSTEDAEFDAAVDAAMEATK